MGAGLLIASVDHACTSQSTYAPAGIETVVEDDFTVDGIAAGAGAV